MNRSSLNIKIRMNVEWINFFKKKIVEIHIEWLGKYMNHNENINNNNDLEYSIQKKIIMK